MKGTVVALAVTTLVVVSRDARAQGAVVPPRVLALVVTNNRSAQLGRPELRYADDDGAKYYELLRTVGDEGDIELLTDFDTDSARLFPSERAVAHAPTRSEVASATRRLAERGRRAQEAGRRVDFYFVFAGHGDVDRGRGFLELSDGRLDSDDIEGLLKQIPSTRAHVILDSCNSFFVLNPRRPGGRQLAVTEQAARSLSDRLPDVGVLLSTSAEAEVFEWSELQSGIFSHAVRSGFFGAADADGDGRVTYDEIRAFVDVATERVENPLFRPKVFARGPNGRNDEPIFDLRFARGLRVELDERERRVTLRDARDLPWVDLHKEAGSRATLFLPAERAMGASIDERDPRAGGTPVVLRRTIEPGGEAGPVQFASLEARPIDARGPNEVLSSLFSAPFGPRALAQWRERAAAQTEPVYGISGEDAERMRLILSQVADSQREGRHAAGAASLAAGALLATGGVWILVDDKLPLADHHVVAYVTIGEGALLTLQGALLLGLRGAGETLYDDFLRDTATPSEDGARVVARTERRLFDMADRARRWRHVLMPLGWAVVGLASAAFVANEIWTPDPPARLENGFIAGCVAFGGLAVGLLGAIQSPVERSAELWANDPAIRRLPRASEGVTVSIGPVRGGAALGIAGAF